MSHMLHEKISTVALVLLITGAIDSIRNLPTTALFGAKLIFFFILAAIIFLIPVALVAAELSALWAKEEGGIYSWVRHAFGETVAFITLWLQWINTMVWYPTILLFIAGTFAYLIHPSLAEHQGYLILTTLLVFWGLTWLGLQGLQASARFAARCAFVGMILPMGLLILCAMDWFIQGRPLSIDFQWRTLLPHWHETQSWASLTAMITSFLGMELAAVHVNQIENPQRHFPRAMFFSVILILVTMILGSLAVAFVLPTQDMSLLQGVMQTFYTYLHHYHLSFMLPIIVILLLIGSLGGMVNWIISPAKGLLLAAQHGFLPRWCYKKNKHGVAHRVLCLQAGFVTVLCGGYVLLPSVNGIYWLFTVLSTELYLSMYVLMFLAAIRLKQRTAHLHRPFKIPGHTVGYYITCMLGLFGCIVGLVVGFIPPDNVINLGGSTHFRHLFIIGFVLMILPAFLLVGYRHFQLKRR